MNTVLKWLVSVVAFTLVDHVVWFLGFLVSRPLYIDARYYPVWSQALLDATKNTISWQTVGWMAVMGLITGLLYTVAYILMKDKLAGSLSKKALMFSLITFATGGVHAMLGGLTMVYLPVSVVAAWLGIAAVSSIATSFTLVAVHKKWFN